MDEQIETIRDYVRGLDLKGTPRGIIHQSAAEEAGEVFDKAKNQAQVIGSGVFSFVTGVTPEVREAISDSALLAQLVANKRVDVEKEPLEWFKTYFDVLQNLGWTLQEGGWDDYSSGGIAGEVHEKIVEIMAAVLAPAPAALAIITSTVKALKAMKPGSSWITIFSRETQKAKIARFQVGLVEKEEGSDVFISLLMCLIEADKTITQVLVFKFKQERASFRANSRKVSVNRTALVGGAPGVRAKIKAYQADYLSSITDI
jgi:hypothetical protein